MPSGDVRTNSQTARYIESPETARARSVFLHTGWRSGGTWLWSRCRQSARVCALYEPLHEQAAHLTPRQIAALRPGSWSSNHGDTAPYFDEFRSHLRPNGRGILRYQPRFAFDDAFPAADDEDPALRAYIEGLLDGPARQGRVAVLKFCRSLGRVPWFEQNFPQALHLVVLRNPVSQWQSCQRLLTQQRNRYFTLAPWLVLARNATNPLVATLAANLDVRLPALHSPDIAYGLETCRRHLRSLDEAAQYRGFLAFWMAGCIAALQSAALVVDAAEIVAEPARRAALEAVLRDHIGEPIGLLAQPGLLGLIPGTITQDMRAAHRKAAAVACAYADQMALERLEFILARLESPRIMAPVVQPPPPPPPPPPPTPWAPRAATWARVLHARALYGARRLYGAVVWRIRKRKQGLLS